VITYKCRFIKKYAIHRTSSEMAQRLAADGQQSFGSLYPDEAPEEIFDAATKDTNST